ncbi:MAG: fucose isomerase [Oscillospiraceae bacterium]|jgi:L-fucose isomerase-like protein|nr:fucose isomerase [Oscillospiraceae bacterium]
MKKTITLGIAPVKRGFLSMEAAKAQKDKFMAVIASLNLGVLKIVDIDDLCENGIASSPDVVPKAIEKFKDARIDALFIPFCDFGAELVASGIAAGFRLPTLVWGARDDTPNTAAARGRDTQCGLFASTKVMRNYGVKFSYIFNEPSDSAAFKDGFTNFIRFAAIVRDMNGLRVLKIGDRPNDFLSVQANESELSNKFNITVVPAKPSELSQQALALIDWVEVDPSTLNPFTARSYETQKENFAKMNAYLEDLKKRYDTITFNPGFPGMPQVSDELNLKKCAALKVVIQSEMEAQGCTVAAFECWSAFSMSLGICPCQAVGDLTDEGLPLSCECDTYGAITMAILRAASLYEDSCFLADLTIRHPQNDNAELLWHCGPFPYSLKNPKSKAGLDNGQQVFELKQGELTMARLGELEGEYYLFAGEGKTTDGPETTNTYVWFEADNWKRWEEKLMFGPYIHHIGGIYGKYLPVLREACRYLGIKFDNAHEQGTYSL